MRVQLPPYACHANVQLNEQRIVMRNRMRDGVFAAAIVMAGSLGAMSFAAAEHRSSGGHGHQCKHHGKQHGKQHGKHRGQHHGCQKHHGMKGHRGKHGGYGDRGINKLLERFDSDKDGKLTQAELDASRKALVEKYDTDKDGKLSLSEFEALWLDVKRRRMVRGFQYIDEDGDALITVEEFLKPYANAVESRDRDGDGTISRDDRRKRMRGGRGPMPSDGNNPGTPE